ncbi:MAG: sialate O-acetylesterase [Acidobacteriota bacterium]|nr:sialate O-acetylesterase [Acidobacteriota bacterium]
MMLVPAAVIAFSQPGALAQVTLPSVLSSHMVVQRNLPVHVWGMATPGEHVTVAFRDESRTVQASALGKWSVYLKPGEAGGPFTMTVRGEAPAERQTLDDILVGDVWLASGQSNMEFQMSRAATAAEDLPKAGIPEVRLLLVHTVASDYAQPDIETDGWKASTPESAKDFSAVAWYFAREIHEREHVPIGVIDSTWGGTVAEAWTRFTALAEDAALAPVLANWGRMTDDEVDAELRVKNEARLVAEAKTQGKPAPLLPWHPQLRSWGPGMLWNGMIAPLTPFPIRGVIWYQGESNSKLSRFAYYDRTMRTLMEDWRRQWGIGAFPFLYVQISNFKSTPLEDWASLREQQVRTLGLWNTGMAVTIDIGNPDDVHPTDKVDVGHRLALWARDLSYGEHVEDSGPLFRQAVPEGAAMRVWFDHAEKLEFKDGGATGFEIAGADGQFVPAIARIEGNTLLVSSPQVAHPENVRYGWANSPECHLFNGEGLPASPFTSVR